MNNRIGNGIYPLPELPVLSLCIMTSASGKSSARTFSVAESPMFLSTNIISVQSSGKEQYQYE